MLNRTKFLVFMFFVGTVNYLGAQAPPPKDSPPASGVKEPAKEALLPPKEILPPLPPPPPADKVAASVNGQEIPELAVYRGLLRETGKNREEARKDILTYLVDNLLIDQYLTQLQIKVETKEIEDRLEQIKAEANKGGQDFKKMLEKLHLSEAELRRELHGALRWDKFVIQQGTEKNLRDLFEKNMAMFDGSQMQARHILLPITEGKAAEVQQKLVGIRKSIEEEVTKELSKSTVADPLEKEKERVKFLVKEFSAVAFKESICPSKEKGGDLGWFPRAGAMVEPFARAAFAMKPAQISEPVQTEFGFHLILTTDQKPGKEVKFDDVSPFVREIYSERLREAIITNYRPKSKIVVNPVK